MFWLIGAALAGAAVANSDDDQIREAAKTQALVEQAVQQTKPSNKVCPAGYACDFDTNTIVKLPE